MEKEKKNTVNPHKYNVGDEITVKITKVEVVGNRPAYRIRGIENIKISERAIEKMQVPKIKPGDIIYMVAVCEEEDIVWFDAEKVDDVATKEIKVCNEWFEFKNYGIFDSEKEAEEYALELAKEHGYKIVKGGLFTQEVDNGRE